MKLREFDKKYGTAVYYTTYAVPYSPPSRLLIIVLLHKSHFRNHLDARPDRHSFKVLSESSEFLADVFSLRGLSEIVSWGRSKSHSYNH
jgi:hypothetical protein